MLVTLTLLAMVKFYGHELVLGQMNALFAVLVLLACRRCASGREAAAGSAHRARDRRQTLRGHLSAVAARHGAQRSDLPPRCLAGGVMLPRAAGGRVRRRAATSSCIARGGRP